MRVLMFSWEYPPLSHGGLARHVQDIGEALTKKGHQIYVITQGGRELPEREIVNGVRVFRADNVSISGNSFVDNILHLNFQLLERAVGVMAEIGDIDLIHGHDWLVFWASKVLKHSLVKPLIYTIHATEFGRNQGIYNNMQRYINDIEWYANYEAWKVIVCSQYMKAEVKNLFQVPEDKIKVIANGVNEKNYKCDDYNPGFRNDYASPDEYMVYYVGRLVREKGIQVLIQAVPEILNYKANTKVVISGRGPYLEHLKNQAEFLGIADRIYFTGFVSDETRNKLYQAADMAVFPSLYEPFGIVALEAMITKTPVIVSNVGGLTEFVQDGKTGLFVNPNDPQQLADKILYLLDNQDTADDIANTGYKMAKKYYSWDSIASQTVDTYKEVLEEYENSEWNKKEENMKNKNDKEFIYRYVSERKYS
ncbi:MAG: glycosyltransferase family 4 protein [Halothermotrichaceae bacterium]